MLWVLPTLPVALVLFMIFGAVSQPLFGEVQRRLSALNTILQENLAGLKVVKAFTREPYEEARFDRAATDLMAQQLRVSRTFSFLFPVVFLIAQIGPSADFVLRRQADHRQARSTWANTRSSACT